MWWLTYPLGHASSAKWTTLTLVGKPRCVSLQSSRGNPQVNSQIAETWVEKQKWRRKLENEQCIITGNGVALIQVNLNAGALLIAICLCKGIKVMPAIVSSTVLTHDCHQTLAPVLRCGTNTCCCLACFQKTVDEHAVSKLSCCKRLTGGCVPHNLSCAGKTGCCWWRLAIWEMTRRARWWEAFFVSGHKCTCFDMELW